VTRIGSVFQDPEHQFVAATVRAEMLVGPRVAGVREDVAQRSVDQILERLRLAPLRDVNPFTLSGGEKRRLSVATALATRPPVIILDEPTFGQDLLTWRELVDLIGELLDDGSAIVAVTHDEPFIRAVASTRFEFFPWDVRPGQLEVVA
jgi:energy-coupling factor transport system ATP-binding protein